VISSNGGEKTVLDFGWKAKETVRYRLRYNFKIDLKEIGCMVRLHLANSETFFKIIKYQL
jgi:hypothetical protein